jgi:hypothetical protein
MGPERKFRNQITPKLKELPNSFFESIQQSTIRGTPDILGVINGRFVALELKAERGRLSEIQAHKLKKIQEAGGFTRVVSPLNFNDVYEELKELSNVHSKK